jgi:hypothetical protein
MNLSSEDKVTTSKKIKLNKHSPSQQGGSLKPRPVVVQEHENTQYQQLQTTVISELKKRK